MVDPGGVEAPAVRGAVADPGVDRVPLVDGAWHLPAVDRLYRPRPGVGEPPARRTAHRGVAQLDALGAAAHGGDANTVVLELGEVGGGLEEVLEARPAARRAAVEGLEPERGAGGQAVLELQDPVLGALGGAQEGLVVLDLQLIGPLALVVPAPGQPGDGARRGRPGEVEARA